MKISTPRLLHSLIFSLFASHAAIAAYAQSPNYDPPSKVARLSLQEGGVSFVENSNSDFQPIVFNRPFLPGESVFVHQGGRAELHIGSAGLRLGERSLLQFESLSDDLTQVRLNQGALAFRVRTLFEQENFVVATRSLKISVQEPGQFYLALDDQQNLRVIVRQGRLLIQGERLGLTLGAGESTTFFDAQLSHSKIVSAPAPDFFEGWAIARDRGEENSVSARYVPRDMVGYQQLDEYGRWETDVTYGSIWFPARIDGGWAPYRHGSWKYLSPWGWTWVDNAPWGFTTCHYGRWVQVGLRWAWVPGTYKAHTRPVYAPALVAFSHHKQGNYVTWFPLGPGEIYRPGYQHSKHYFDRMNAHYYGVRPGHNKHITNVYIHQNVSSAVTTIDVHRFTRGDHVGTSFVSTKGPKHDWSQVTTIPPKFEGKFNTGAINHESRIPPDIRTKHERRYADSANTTNSNGNLGLNHESRVPPDIRSRSDKSTNDVVGGQGVLNTQGVNGAQTPTRPTSFDDRSGIPNLPKTLNSNTTSPSNDMTAVPNNRHRPIYGDGPGSVGSSQNGAQNSSSPSAGLNAPSNVSNRSPLGDSPRRDETRSPVMEPARQNRSIDLPQLGRPAQQPPTNQGSSFSRPDMPNQLNGSAGTNSIGQPRNERRPIEEPSSWESRRNSEIQRPSVTISPPRETPPARPVADSMPRPERVQERSAGFNVPSPAVSSPPRPEVRMPAVSAPIPAPRSEPVAPRAEPRAPEKREDNKERELRNR